MEGNKNIELREFIPLSKVDPVFYETVNYLGAGEGGEKAYRLLTDAMIKSGRAALAKTVTRGKEELVLIRPYQNGLLLHTMFCTNGIRDFNQVRKGETARVSEEENRLALGLIDQMASEEFAPDTYRNEHRERVLAFLQEKGKGQLITPPSPERRLAGR